MSRTCQQGRAIDDAAPKRRARRWATALFKAPMLVITAVGFVALSPGNAFAAQVSCGDTIIANTTLHADLVSCSGSGLVIGADRITLNLNGHTITGSLNGAAGIDNSAGHDGVTIKNGAVRDFTNGVLLLEHASGNLVQRLTLVSDNSTGAADNGVLIFDSDHNHVAHNSVSGSFNGIFLGNTTDSTVDRNRVSGVNTGIILFDADRNAIKRNTLTDFLDTGAAVFGGADNVISENSASGGEAGVSIEGDRNAVSGNRLIKNGDDLRVSGDDNTVVGNLVRDALGCEDNGCGAGIAVEGGSGNIVAANSIARTRHEGIRLDNFAGAGGPPAIGNVFRSNLVRAADTDGIAVATSTDPASFGSTVKDTLLRGNVVIGSGHDGINVASATTTLTRNLAVRNANLGIEAVLGVIDGGGNHAFGNGNPAQCINVACEP